MFMFDKIAFSILIALISYQVNGLTHYPPSNTPNTDLSQVLNGTGAPGNYWSSNTPDEEYGSYNCKSEHFGFTQTSRIS
ncbi:uncharacterized protein IL334_001289 [Kwoniella shivajii]|uniref:Uncharacterized protein n=1 Tax=Kwoniella shivajii TaxID=564305 RepID=A0ABZ1CRH2_9TREE|nr:hypothetical protein IL334_001289 [Kwoniella shivajii]